MKKRIRKDAGTERTVVMEKFSPITNSRKWTTANLAIEAIRDRFTSYERVHYEDFTASPSSTLSDTLSGMPVPMFPSTLIQNGIVHLGDNHMIWGNPNRKARGPITIQEDTEWLASMSRIDRMKACLWSWPLMVAYGYVPVFPDH